MASGSSVQKRILLSPSALNLFRECPRCFWLEKIKNIKRPRGIFPSLPSGMDRVIKTYFDQYREKGTLPPEFAANSLAGLQLYSNQRQLDLWREWKTGPRFDDADGSALSGAIDDLMVHDGKYVPFDYKTKGEPFESAESAGAYAERYYQSQIDCYALILEKSGLPQSGFGFLVFYSPKQVRENAWVGFNVRPVRIQTDPARALTTFRNAVALLKGPVPDRSSGCEYCAWLGQFEPAKVFTR